MRTLGAFEFTGVLCCLVSACTDTSVQLDAEADPADSGAPTLDAGCRNLPLNLREVEVVACNQLFPRDLTRFDNDLWWVNELGTVVRNHDGKETTVTRLDGDPAEIRVDQTGAFVLLYRLAPMPPQILHFGFDGALIETLGSSTRPGIFEMDAGYFYWFADEPSAIWSLPRTGGAATKLFQLPSGDIGNSFAVGPTSISWSGGAGTGAPGMRIWRMAKTATTARLVAEIPTPMGPFVAPHGPEVAESPDGSLYFAMSFCTCSRPNPDCCQKTISKIAITSSGGIQRRDIVGPEPGLVRDLVATSSVVLWADLDSLGRWSILDGSRNTQSTAGRFPGPVIVDQNNAYWCDPQIIGDVASDDGLILRRSIW